MGAVVACIVRRAVVVHSAGAIASAETNLADSERARARRPAIEAADDLERRGLMRESLVVVGHRAHAKKHISVARDRDVRDGVQDGRRKRELTGLRAGDAPVGVNIKRPEAVRFSAYGGSRIRSVLRPDAEIKVASIWLDRPEALPERGVSCRTIIISKRINRLHDRSRHIETVNSAVCVVRYVELAMHAVEGDVTETRAVVRERRKDADSAGRPVNAEDLAGRGATVDRRGGDVDIRVCSVVESETEEFLVVEVRSGPGAGRQALPMEHGRRPVIGCFLRRSDNPRGFAHGIPGINNADPEASTRAARDNGFARVERE